MRQFGPKLAVHKSAGHGCQQVHNENGVTSAHEYEHGARAGTGQRPSHSEDAATYEVAGYAFVFVFDHDFLAFRILQVLPLDELHDNDACHYSRTNNAEHVEALKTKHFINPEVGYSFALVQGKA